MMWMLRVEETTRREKEVGKRWAEKATRMISALYFIRYVNYELESQLSII
jgi:hypothetical protein